ncbi:MAG: hypothetical protein RLN76_07610 [Phycisphaeraceae bacterium]
MRNQHLFLWAALGLSIFFTQRVLGQDEGAERLVLDWRALVLEPGVLEAGVADPVWTLEPRPGRRQVMIPFEVVRTEGEAEVELRSPGVGLRGGQFQAWYIPFSESNLESDGPSAAPVSALGGLGGGGFGAAGGFAGGAGGGFGGGVSAVGGGGNDADQGPRLAKSIVILPGGGVRWDMDRVITGATLSGSGGSGYLLKLDPAAMRDQRPTPPERRQPGAAVDRQAQREEQARFRSEMSAYNDLRDQLKALPETFEAEPVRIWGVYSLSEREDMLEFSGLNDPNSSIKRDTWGVSMLDLEALRARAVGTGVSQTEADPGLAARLVSGGHPLGMRLLALAEARGGAMNAIETADVRVLAGVRTMLSVPDEPTRQIVVEALSNGETIGPQSTMLLQAAAQDPSAEVRLTAVTGLLRGDPAEPGLSASVTQMLEGGEVSAVTVLDRVAEQADAALGGRQRGGGEDTSGAWAAMLDVLPVDVAAERNAEVVRHVVVRSSESQAARRWLSGLLGSGLESVRSETIAALAQWPSDRAPLVLSEADDPLVVLLEAGDAGAWTALAAFAPDAEDGSRRSNRSDARGFAAGGMGGFAGGGGFGAAGGGAQVAQASDVEEAPARSVYERVLLAATGMEPTPVEVVGFVSRASDREAADGGLLVIAGEGSGPAAQQAARLVLQSPSSFQQVLNRQPMERRGELMAGLYGAMGQEAPAVAALLSADERGEQTRWLSELVDRGVLPDQATWAMAFSSDDVLLAFTVSDDDLIAEAAWTALAIRAGGDATLGERIRDDAVAEGVGDAEAARAFWEGWKSRINAEQIGARSGSYRLGVELADRREGATKSASLGLIELYEEGGRLRVRGEGLTVEPGEAPLSLVLTNPVELEMMSPDGPTVLPGTRWPERIVLSSRADGGWEGEERAGMWVVRVRLEWVG